MNFIAKQQLIFISLLLFFSSFVSTSQEVAKDWHLLDLKKDKISGISLEQAYDLLKENNIKTTPVIVAVLDSGLDIDHEDLSPAIWINKMEVIDNGTDDDANGYVDDINGWNFIGNKNGESLEAETLELTRLYRKYSAKFKDRNKFSIKPEDIQEYRYYLALMKEYDEGHAKLKKQILSSKEEFEYFNKLIPPLQKAINKDVFTKDELKKFKAHGQLTQNLKANFLRILERNKDKDLTSVKLIKHYEGLKKSMKELETRLLFNYNLEFDGRKIVGDNYANLSEKFYGNADVSKRSEHGTHVSGIIGAIRNNGKGINGIAKGAIIMPIRNTPMGDETDKDVANGIRYAVDNGAKIINMSFGKAYSPNKEIVDAAIKYAQEKGVLLIHGAGNDNKNTDLYYSYPSPLFEDGTIATNWIEVGASSVNLDEKLAATFSNYGKQSVDIFAPGVDIYSTLPNNAYDTRSGTSMAAPVVSGVAALLLSHFSHLSPEQVKEIILASGTEHHLQVNIPGSDDQKITFSSLSKSGKIINAYKAVKLALEKYND